MTQTPILTVTLNPAIDISTSTAHVVGGPKLRCTAPETDPGGGGINVSRAIQILGGQSTAFVALGGATGERLAGMLIRSGLTLAGFDAPGETRESFSVIDGTTHQQYRFVLPGTRWPKAATGAALEALSRAVPPEAFVVLSGSQPPGVDPDFPVRLSRRLAGRGVRLILDTSGAPLIRVAEGRDAGLFALRMNHDEAADLAGHRLETRTESADFAQRLVRDGVAEVVIVARGAEGNVLATRDERLFASAYEVPVKSRVGAGDCFVGAFTLSLARGETIAEALKWGTATASAAVMTPGTKLCTVKDVRRLMLGETVSRV
ncbi:MAG: 1-phosphofructokinase family hexose kinase [Rhodobacteraceae bacterium]|nr:1-phosphofructokinase family hexose kinase [Paracoccaceae bacterium]